ncbi:MAG: Verru_Chthon cassette protein B [Chthoniobacteraceae bacterium]
MKSPDRGFSLIEIVLAIGVVSFALIAILGLISAGVNSSRSALNESLMAAMSRQIVSDLRQQQFASNSLFTSVNSGTSTLQTAYFDANGVRLLSSDGLHDVTAAEAKQQQAIFQCDVTASSDTDRMGPVAATVSVPCLVNVMLTFQWPLGAKNPSRHCLYTSIGKYY